MAEEKQGTTEDQPSGAAEFERELSDSFVDHDTGDDVEQPEPVVDEEPVQPEPVQPVEAEPVTDEPAIQEPKKYKVPDDALYGELRGKKATALELEAAGLLDKVLGREHQELHHVKLYQDLRKEFEDYRKAQDERIAAQPKQQQPAGPAMSPEEYAANIENQYVPELQQLASQGSFEPDFLRAYPKVSSHIEHRFRSGGFALGATVQHVTKLTEAVNEIREYVGMKQNDESRMVAQQTLSQKLDEASTSMPALSDATVRERFTNWASDPENALTDRMATQDIKDLTKEQILGAFAAYVAMTGDGVSAQSQQRRRPRSGSNMAGGGGASRGSSTPGSNSPRSNAEGFEQELVQSGWRG